MEVPCCVFGWAAPHITLSHGSAEGVVLSFPHSYELADQNCNDHDDHHGSRQIEPPCFITIWFNPILQSLWFKCYAFVVFCVARITTFLGKWWLIKEVCNFRESTQKLFIEVIIIFSIIVYHHFNVLRRKPPPFTKLDVWVF